MNGLILKVQMVPFYNNSPFELLYYCLYNYSIGQ